MQLRLKGNATLQQLHHALYTLAIATWHCVNAQFTWSREVQQCERYKKVAWKGPLSVWTSATSMHHVGVKAD